MKKIGNNYSSECAIEYKGRKYHRVVTGRINSDGSIICYIGRRSSSKNYYTASTVRAIQLPGYGLPIVYIDGVRHISDKACYCASLFIQRFLTKVNQHLVREGKAVKAVANKSIAV